MAITKTNSSTVKRTEAPKPKQAPKPAPKAPEVKTNDVAKKADRDEVKLSSEVDGKREARRSGDKDPSAEAADKPEGAEGQEPGTVDQNGNRVDKDGNHIDEDGNKVDENGKPIDEEKEQMKKEIEEIKGLLESLSENFKAQEAGAGESGGESSGGESSPSEGGAPAAAPAQQAQQPQQAQGGALDTQLSQLAIQLLSRPNMGQGGGLQNGMQGGPQGAPMSGNAGNGQMAINGNFSGQQSSAAGDPRSQLSSLYSQTGGPNNKSVRPETHQLVQLALGLGGGFGMNSVIGAGNGQSQGFPTQMGMNPNFGGVQNFANFR